MHTTSDPAQELIGRVQRLSLARSLWDGSGYPHGLAGTAIPEAGRIVALADVYDALTSPRPYKEAWTHAAARAELERLSGRQFDPAVVAAFLRLD